MKAIPFVQTAFLKTVKNTDRQIILHNQKLQDFIYNSKDRKDFHATPFPALPWMIYRASRVILYILPDLISNKRFPGIHPAIAIEIRKIHLQTPPVLPNLFPAPFFFQTAPNVTSPIKESYSGNTGKYRKNPANYTRLFLLVSGNHFPGLFHKNRCIPGRNKSISVPNRAMLVYSISQITVTVSETSISSGSMFIS